MSTAIVFHYIYIFVSCKFLKYSDGGGGHSGGGSDDWLDAVSVLTKFCILIVYYYNVQILVHIIAY